MAATRSPGLFFVFLFCRFLMAADRALYPLNGLLHFRVLVPFSLFWFAGMLLRLLNSPC
ncbi:unnamed protein product [Linum tenue]|uniref:Uncharacterized protein n=1 Tax=Linum tenue TaxID=586396 RepID=A0AAV0J3M1_9ROSI|nr:unnamed protein product [Linum tenue]